MRFQVKDIVKTGLEYGDRLFAIVRIQDGKYYAVAMTNKKRYWLTEGQIREKTGTIPDNSPLLLLDDAYDPYKGNAYAQRRAAAAKGEAKQRWGILSKLNPGEVFDVVVNKIIYPAVFVQINITKPVRVFRARVQGRALDLPLNSVYLQV